MTNPILATHSGKFHCDEVMAIVMLKYLREYEDAEIMRTRDPELLSKADVVVDVGGIFDHQTKRYDHHQSSFSETFDEIHKTRLSSSGLIYKYYAKAILNTYFGIIDDPLLEIVYKRVYKNLMEAIDGHDNGVGLCLPSSDSHKPKYAYSQQTDLPHRVDRLNPAWNEPASAHPDDLFKEAMKIAQEEFEYHVLSTLKVWWPAREIVRKAVENRYETHKCGQIILIEPACPFIEHLYDIEDEMEIDEPILYVIFRDPSNTWRVRTVSIIDEPFASRQSLPQQFRGLRDDVLCEKTGIEDQIFIHATGFIGGTKTKEAALKLAELSLNLQSSK